MWCLAGEHGILPFQYEGVVGAGEGGGQQGGGCSWREGSVAVQGEEAGLLLQVKSHPMDLLTRIELTLQDGTKCSALQTDPTWGQEGAQEPLACDSDQCLGVFS